MIDFGRIGEYSENNRIEAKRALGGLPRSIWETYSAFANSFGGILLLGVEELADKTFRTVNLPAPEKLVAEFWEIIGDKSRVSENILSKWDVEIHNIGGDRMISITVPRADRRRRPVYIGNNPYLGTYRRDGEGDYHCTREEVRMMLRDRQERTLDEKVLPLTDESLSGETLRRYRAYLQDMRAGDGYGTETDGGLLCRIGAGKRDGDGQVHPTAAGLLMFGFEDEIVKQYPYFYLDYQERDTDGQIRERIVSNSGKWSGNLFDFYLKISGKIVRGLPHDIHRPVREAVANCMVNGDYMGSGGLVMIKKQDEICITNPGSFRIDIQEAVNGGRSDLRNVGIARLFHLVRVGTRTGNGVPDLYKVWSGKGWKIPEIQERLKPDRITFKLPLAAGEKSRDSLFGRQEYREAILDYVTWAIYVAEKDVADILGTGRQEAAELLQRMLEDGILVRARDREGYRLKI